MKRIRRQFRISTLLRLTTAIACGCGFFHVAGLPGVLVLLGLLVLGIVVVLLAVAYVRIMSYLFDVIIGPFLS